MIVRSIETHWHVAIFSQNLFLKHTIALDCCAVQKFSQTYLKERVKFSHSKQIHKIGELLGRKKAVKEAAQNRIVLNVVVNALIVS